MIHEAFKNWQAEILPAVVAQYGDSDTVAASESWNDYTDALCKDGELTGLQYHYCPAHDDAMPADDDQERAHILREMGVALELTRVRMRPDAGDWHAGSQHFSFKVSRAGREYSGHYSQGQAHTAAPDLCDVLAALLMDSSGADQPFEDWAADLGFDPDSRKAESVYNACGETLAALERMFSADDLNDLRELFADY